MLFSNPGAAQACKTYIISDADHSQKATPSDTISLCCIEFGRPNIAELSLSLPPLYAVVYPPESSCSAAVFWRLTGTGISSRQAECCLEVLHRMHKVDAIVRPTPQGFHPVYEKITSRIASLIERSPIVPPRKRKATSKDIYLHPSGMSAIYHIHHLLLDWRGAQSVVLGLTYELTLKIMETYGPSHEFYSAATDEDIDNFECYLEGKIEQGSKIQAVWCECHRIPSFE